MLITPRHVLAWSIGAALTAFLIMAAWCLLRAAGEGGAAAWDVEIMTLGVVLAAATAAGTLWWAGWSMRNALVGLTEQVSSVRHGPSRASFTNRHLSSGQLERFGPLYTELEALCASYRQALALRVRQREAIDSLRSRLDGDPGNGQPPRRAPGASRNMVARLTPNLRWLNATPALLKFLGRSMDDIRGRAFLEEVHPKSFATVTARLAEALQSGETHGLEIRLLVHRRRGETESGPARSIVERRHVRLDVATRYSDDGKPIHLRCYFEDITDRKRAEQQLRRRTIELTAAHDNMVKVNEDLQRLKESYRDLYHNAPTMFFSLDDRGQFVACNNTMLHALGYPREDLLQKPFATLLTPNGAADWREALGKAAPGEPPHALMVDGECEMQWTKHDGTVIDVWIRSIPLTDAEGRFVRSRSAAHDVTQRNRLANELRARGDQLEIANDELRAINKELDDFTYAVSHGLKEPLRTLEACSNVLADDFSTQLGADGFEWINHILTASRRLAKMIDDFLSLARAGHIATTPRVFHLNEAVALVRRDMGEMILRKNATFTVEGSLPAIVGDLERVTQLLTNLVANGLKYNVDSRPSVVIGEADRVDKPGFATLFVRDNGIGIDPKYHKEIFGVFRRLHRKEEYEGTGAGLAICHKIVQAHAGKLWVESAPGKGTTFFFTLPRSPRDSALLPSAAVPSAEGTAAADTNGTQELAIAANLLLVEDMAEMALIVQRFARKAGHGFHWAPTAEDAWEYLDKNRPDLVLLDIHLPGMDGIELCQKLRDRASQADLPIALFSQDVTPEDIRTGLAAGADFVLSKRLLCEPDAWRQQLHQILRSCQQSTSRA
jgi:PAS domain S-box-containing protein